MWYTHDMIFIYIYLSLSLSLHRLQTTSTSVFLRARKSETLAASTEAAAVREQLLHVATVYNIYLYINTVHIHIYTYIIFSYLFVYLCAYLSLFIQVYIFIYIYIFYMYTIIQCNRFPPLPIVDFCYQGFNLWQLPRRLGPKGILLHHLQQNIPVACRAGIGGQLGSGLERSRGNLSGCRSWSKGWRTSQCGLSFSREVEKGRSQGGGPSKWKNMEEQHIIPCYWPLLLPSSTFFFIQVILGAAKGLL